MPENADIPADFNRLRGSRADPLSLIKADKWSEMQGILPWYREKIGEGINRRMSRNARASLPAAFDHRGTRCETRGKRRARQPAHGLWRSTTGPERIAGDALAESAKPRTRQSARPHCWRSRLH
jgi:hypothetical protein